MNSEVIAFENSPKLRVEEYSCPVCFSLSLRVIDHKFYCSNSSCFKFDNPFLQIEGKPVLIDFSKSLCEESFFKKRGGESTVVRTQSRINLFIRNIINGRNRTTVRNVESIIQQISQFSNPRILIVGGGEIGSGMDALYKKFSTNIISFDIYNTANIDFIADAHDIPLHEEYFDLVIIQAVLEHVLMPEKVVSEIYRVLKPEGLVYAETPFMQQVHEGPYDFTRFTESGHRFLFKKFELILSGYTAGAGSALLWSLDFFFSGLFKSRKVGKVIRVLFFWLRKFDNLIPSNFNLDAASGNFFLGKKTQISFLNKHIVSHYKGAQRVVS